jgi:hypothetical protein
MVVNPVVAEPRYNLGFVINFAISQRKQGLAAAAIWILPLHENAALISAWPLTVTAGLREIFSEMI